ncbi:putative cytochrome c oxidase subunit Vib [Scheffersomyces coipomensis]|uniref:putative cytochrome c oxidase subunit Vib n=1 Tax=Scheffersomyces coipomensis TaxID=1788519 RepID=UPI00315C5094
MGFFTKSEEETTSVPPNKAKRQVCWDSRDKFFACLTENKIDNSLDAKILSKVDKQCGDLKVEFENNCVKSWVKYFQEKRFNDLVRQRYIEKLEAEGAKPLPIKLESSTRREP